MNLRSLTAIASLSAVLLASWSPAAAVDVGAAACDITPDLSKHRVPLAGYGAREGEPAAGVHDSIQAKVLYFRDADTRMAIVTLDLRSVTPEFKRQIVERTHDLGLRDENLLVCASHTHAAPSIYPEPFWQRQFGVYDPEIVVKMTETIAHALHRAAENAAPAKIGFGADEIEGFTANRRWGYDAEAREQANETPAVDPKLWIMRIDSVEGRPRAIVVNFATHPTIMGADNMSISAEWPGVLQRELESRYPGAVALFTNGAEGDQRPAGAQGEGFDRIEDFGRRLANEADRIAKDVSTTANLPIAYLLHEPELPPLEFSETARERYPHMAPLAQEALPRRAVLQFLRIGDRLLVGLPGEPIIEVGAATAEQVETGPIEEAVVVGLANDYIGYILNEKEYAHGGYEVDARSYYGPGLGAFVARQAGEAVMDWLSSRPG